MKAKEYAKRVIDQIVPNGEPLPSEDIFQQRIDDATKQVVIDMIDEAMYLCKVRHSKSTSCLMSALKEQGIKWRAFAKLVNKRFEVEVVKPDGFKDFILNLFPEMKGHV